MKKIVLSLGAALLVLAGCGGGGGGGGSGSTLGGGTATPSAALSGTFTDAPVVGLNYVTSSGSGGCTSAQPCATQAGGRFQFATGDSVTFSAAGVTLGTTGNLQASSSGNTSVTPVDLVAGATSASDAGPTAIAQFLQTLNTITANTTGGTANGVLTMPSGGTSTSVKNALVTAGVTATTPVASVVAQLQAALNNAFGANQFTVTPAAAAQAALAQGVNGAGLIGTVWSGTCTCGGGATVYFQPDGTATGFTSEGSLLAGNWSASTTVGTVQVQLNSSGGGYGTGSVASNASSWTGTVYGKTGAVKGTIQFNKISAGSSAPTNTLYVGGWYANYTPNAARIAAGDKGGSAYIVAALDGNLYGITDNSAKAFQGTWTISSGQGTVTWTDSSTGTISITVDFSLGTGTVSINGAAAGTLSLNRTGTLTRSVSGTGSGASGNPIPLLLNVADSWANNGNTVSSLALSLNIYDSTGALISSTVKSESTAPLSTGVRTTTTDNISASYPSGGAATYSLSVGPANCTITNGSGTVVDANSGNAGAYPTVYITCDPNSQPSPPIPLVLNIVTSWANTANSANSLAMNLNVFDAQGKQIALGLKSVTEGNAPPNGVRSTTTDSMAVSYTQGAGASYRVVMGPAAAVVCSVTAGGSGPIVDANSGNAAAYPTVSISCQ